MAMLKSVYNVFIFTFAMISIAIVSGCANKNYYTDIYGHSYYRASDDHFYYKNNKGVYVLADNQDKNGPSEENTVLADKVMAALKADMDTRDQLITVKSMNNQIVLGGYVNHDNQRLKAIEIARNVPGVRLVVSTISIKLL